MGSPNGDTPLPDGNLLVSEITGSWVSEYTMTGTLAWTVYLPNPDGFDLLLPNGLTPTHPTTG